MHIQDRFYIGGEWVEPAQSGAVLEVVSPFTEEVVGRVPEAAELDMDRAVAAARRAFEEGPWPRMAPSERAALIAALANEIRGRSQEFAQLITLEMGSPISWSLVGQALAPTMLLDAFAALAAEFPFEEERQGMLGTSLVRHVPVGVAAGILPWNVPLFIAAFKLGAAMTAGAPLILKPSPETPLDSYLLAQAAEKVGLPPGVLNIVPAGREVGEYLVRHPDIDKVSFTGSTAAGRKIAAICGEQLKRCTLELGGKSAAVVLDDVDLATALPGIMSNSIINNGQACLSQTRILAPRSRYDEVVDAVSTAVREMKVGDPMDPEVGIGPLVSQRQKDRVNGYIELGVAEGARVALGAGKPAFDRGWFVDPTVFADVDNHMRIAQEEIFGPVLCIISYDGDEEAVRIANDSAYGLSGSVWTQDPARGVEIAKGVRTGTYGVNSVATMDLRNPFGGFKASGIGREAGREGIEAYCEIQTIVLPPGYEG